MVSASAATVEDRSGAVMTEADGLPLNRPNTASAFGDYDDDTSEVARLGVNLSGREVERLADLFLAVEEAALEGPKTRLESLLDRQLSTSDSGLS
jgi:hypothetical protein